MTESEIPKSTFGDVVAATAAILIDGNIVGTGWLFSNNGHVATAGHFFNSAKTNIEVRFSDQTPIAAKLIQKLYDPDTGADAAILKVDIDHGQKPVSVCLLDDPEGPAKIVGYGVTLRDKSSGSAEFVGVFEPLNSASNLLFRLRTQETGEPGFSGAAVFSESLGAVVGIQIESTTCDSGPGRDTILAFPLFRLARNWTSFVDVAAFLVNTTPKERTDVEDIVRPEVPSEVTVIDCTLESKLIQEIQRQRLYSLGRFNTYQTEVALSWVQVGPLLNRESLLSSLIQSSARWLRSLVDDADSTTYLDKVALIGVDCWGSVIASQLTVVTGAKNFCVAARAQGRHHTTLERANDTVVDGIKACELIVCVSDVIATGNTLRHVYDTLHPKLTAAQVFPRWGALSVIFDTEQRRDADLSFVSHMATACGNLRMPVVSDSSLPARTVLPPIIAFE